VVPIVLSQNPLSGSTLPSPVPYFELCRLGKQFGGTVALNDVSLAIMPGQAHAIVGENGAGKSTLIKIMSGNLKPDTGTLRLAGRPLRLVSPAAARRQGIAVIHQELSIIPDLTVAENIFLGQLPLRRFGLVDFAALRDGARTVLHQLGLDIDPELAAGQLPIALQQMVEIAKGIASGARILVMDEPTSSLGPREAERLWAVTAELRRHGTTILFVSHKLDEVLANAEMVTVLRDGNLVTTEPAAQLDTGRLVTLMIGRDIAQAAPRIVAPSQDTVLRVRGLRRGHAFADVDFEVRSGEIVGFSGLVGAGRTEMMRCVFGADRPDAGAVQMAGRTLPAGNARAAIAAGMGFVPESRKEQGLFLNLGILENMSLPAGRTGPLGFLRTRDERKAALEGARALNVAAHSLDQDVVTLSGGNQQKVILARWLRLAPRLLIVDEPTRGIDVGAKAEIYEILRAQANAGRAVLVVSSELPEILALSSRIIVMRAGRIAGQLDRAEASEERLGGLAIGY
jgi:rhamnose transport system ATP-binding protein